MARRRNCSTLFSRPAHRRAARRPRRLAAWLQPAPGQALEDHLYIVDPMGEWMMRMPAQTPSRRGSSATSNACCARRPPGTAGPLNRAMDVPPSTSRLLARLALLALLVALLPLAWVWLRQRGADTRTRLAALTALTLFLTFDLIVFGSFTRLTDSGLGCPDWPGCYGEASPFGARADIHAAQTAMPSGPVTWSKAWIEMIHRYLAMTVGVLILVMAAVVAGRSAGGLPHSPWWPTLTLVWVVVQGCSASTR
jgi:heme A synthase